MYEYSSKFLNDMQKVTKIFTKTTSNNIIFTSITGAIVDCDTILFDSSTCFDYLRNLNFLKYSLFPLAINSTFSGFFILDTSQLEHDAIKMCQSYLECSTHQFITDASDSINVLSPIEASKVSSLTRSLTGLLATKDEPLNNQKYAITNEPYDNAPNDIEKNILVALKYIDDNLEKPLTLEDVSQRVFLSPSYLSRIFKNYFNDNFINYINLRKIALAQEKLVLSNTPINKLARQVGFSQISYFTKIFKDKVGMTPSKYRKYNSAIKKIWTIPRDLNWDANKSVYEISKNFFVNNEISFKARDLNGYPYIYSINGLNDIPKHAGWVYTVDCFQPIVPASEVNVLNSSVIQWIYTEKII